MKEGAPTPDQKQEQKRSGYIEAGLAAMALLGAVDQGPAEALEIEPNASWSVGIQKLQRTALQEKNESVAVYVSFKDGKGVWPSLAEGEQERAQYSPEAEAKFLLNNSKTKGIERHCVIHTHPNQVITKFGKNFEFRYSPPSSVDIVGAQELNHNAASYLKFFNISIKQYETAVADSSGIWYYGGAPNVRPTPEQEKAFMSAFQQFGVATLKPEFNFQIEYVKLQQVYRATMQGDIRFVPYEKIKDEPACAGVNYAPQKGGTTPTQRPTLEQKPSQNRTQDGPPYHVGPPQR